jgi:hypothetical protein
MSTISIMPKLAANAMVASVAVQARHLLMLVSPHSWFREGGFGLTCGSKVFGPMQSVSDWRKPAVEIGGQS